MRWLDEVKKELDGLVIEHEVETTRPASLAIEQPSLVSAP